jgi:hypothetical protein
MDDCYTRKNFPEFVANHGNWDIYMNPETQHCAAIPTDKAAAEGCRATHFGDREYVKATLGV